MSSESEPSEVPAKQPSPPTIAPGAAERLAERAMRLEEKKLDAITRKNDQIHEETMFIARAADKRDGRAQWMAFILGCVILGGSFGLVVTGATIGWLTGVVWALAMLVNAFFKGPWANRRQRFPADWPDSDDPPQHPDRHRSSTQDPEQADP